VKNIVDAKILKDLTAWYDDYACSFKTGDLQLEDAVQLKYDHTKRVVNEMELLCESISLDNHRRILAAIAALFHDVARFEQFKRYRTFSDKRSFNHAEAALDVIDEHRLFAALDSYDAATIRCAIRHHNAVRIPDGLTEEHELFSRLLRDADKLDIYRIALDYYVNPDPLRHETVQIGIPDGAAVTPEVCMHVLRGEIVPYEKIQTVTDFKMIQLGWVFDLNFPHSFRCVKERGYVDDIKKLLPSTSLVEKTVAAVVQYLDDQIR
jgi:hypothetical protein